MRTLQDFKNETIECTNLAEFVLTSKEWADFESGTHALRVKTFNDNGRLYSREYILKDINNMDEVLEDVLEVAPGYYTDTTHVTRK